MKIIINTWTAQAVSAQTISESELQNPDFMIFDTETYEIYRDGKWSQVHRIDYENPYIVLKHDLTAQRLTEVPDSAICVIDTGSRKFLADDGRWYSYDITKKWWKIMPNGHIVPCQNHEVADYAFNAYTQSIVTSDGNRLL